MIDATEFEELKASVEEAKNEYERSLGALSELTNRLKKEFNCATVGEAEKLLRKMETERDQLEKSYAKEKAAYIKKWHHGT